MKLVCPLILLWLSIAHLADPAKDSPIGRKIDDFKLRDYRGTERSLADFADKKLVVVTFIGSECPVAKLYGPRLAALAREFEPKGVAFIGINANQQDSVTAIKHFARLHGISYPILKDVANVVADQMGAVRTPEAFVLDSGRVVRYRGRIDDQYGVGYGRPKIGRRDLAIALEELLAGKAVSTPTTQASGCFIGRVRRETKPGPVTYAKHVAPILQKRCLECHRPGQIAPFSLTSYDEVVGWTETIREVVQERRMPPWHADPKYGEFANDSRLPDDERQTILRWIDGGAPSGDPRDLPKPAEFTPGWRIPKPDVVVSIPKPFKVPAEGTVQYQYFAVDPGFDEDRWIKAAEVRPGCRPVVHHILVFVQEPGKRGTDRSGGFANNWLAASVPGAKPLILTDGRAKRIPAGSRLLFQIHYTPNGSPQVDQSNIALVFTDPRTVHQEVLTDMAANPRLRIPPGASNHKVEADTVLHQDTVLLSFMPHTHLRGKAFQYQAIYPDGTIETLLDVPRYDFNWQNTYVLSKPKLLPKGTKIHCSAHYDNSKDNLANPDPNREVRWGEQTWQEMMIGYFDITIAGQDLWKHPTAAIPPVRRQTVSLEQELARLAQHALKSQNEFESFAVAVRHSLPQVDRVCVTSFSDEKLHVERSAYPGQVTRHFAETGFEVPAQASMLVGYALFNQFIFHADLKKTRGDLAKMGQTLGSSAHVPIALEGRPATLNFWSKEKNAFTKEQEPLLQAIAKKLVGKATREGESVP
jgi:peroxiredoxin